MSRCYGSLCTCILLHILMFRAVALIHTEYIRLCLYLNLRSQFKKLCLLQISFRNVKVVSIGFVLEILRFYCECGIVVEILRFLYSKDCFTTGSPSYWI